MSSRVSLTPAWVLHSRAFQESSLILDVFSQANGRLSIIAKGVRKRKASNRSLLQPFHPLLLSFTGKGSMKTLTQVESQAAAMSLQGDSLFAGFYCNELLQRLLPDVEPMPELFQAYSTTIAQLSTDWTVAIRQFELLLLDELGYGLNLTAEADSGTDVLPQRYYYFVIEQGLYAVQGVAPKAYPRLSGKSCLALASGQIEQADKVEAARLMKYCLAYYLGDKPLKTRELWKALKA